MTRLMIATLATLAAPATLLGGCGSADAPAPAPAPAVPAPPIARPSPGVDLAGPIAPPDRRARGGSSGSPALVSDLTSDRAVVHVAVPSPPLGGAVRFQLAEDRSGWVARIPDAGALPAVAYGGDKIFVSGGFDAVTFYGLDAATGRLDWATTNLEDNGPTAPVYDDGRVVFNTESCTVFALDAATGRRVWLKKLGDPTLAQTAVSGGVVFAAHPAEGGHELSAFRVDSGV